MVSKGSASLKACRQTNCDDQLRFPPSICFNLFKRAEADFFLIRIDELAWNQLSHVVVGAHKTVTSSSSSLQCLTALPLSTLLLLLLDIAVSISASPRAKILSQ